MQAKKEIKALIKSLKEVGGTTDRAAHLGRVSTSTIHRIVNGETSPSEATMSRIRDGFNRAWMEAKNGRVGRQG